jgi:hypothetical protein
VQKDGYYISGYNNSNIYPTYASNSPSGDNLNGVNKMGNSSNNASNNGVAYGNNSNNATYSNSKGMNSNIYKNLFDSVSLNQFFSPQIDDAYEPAPRK